MLVSPLLTCFNQDDGVGHMDELDLLQGSHFKSVRELLKLGPGLRHTQILELDLGNLGLNDAVCWLADAQVADHTVLAQD